MQKYAVMEDTKGEIKQNINSLTSQLEGTEIDLIQRSVNVKQPPFNAKGDGVTDDTVAIQSAINYVIANGGGSVFIPSGVYVYSQLIIERKTKAQEWSLNITIKGEFGTILKHNGTVTDSFYIRGALSETTVGDSFARFVTLHDIKFQGLSAFNMTAIRVERVQSVNFRNVVIDNFKQHGLFLKSTFDSHFSNVEIIRCGRGNSPTDAAYALALSGGFDQTNACKFFTLRVEHCPLMLTIDSGSRHNYFIGCKFEQSALNSSGNNPIAIAEALEIGFNNCQFVKNQNTLEHFFGVNVSLDSHNSTYKVEKVVNVSESHFICQRDVVAAWFNVNFTKIKGCTFNSTNGNGDYPFVFGRDNVFSDNVVVIPTVGTNVIRLRGNRNLMKNNKFRFSSSSVSSGVFLALDSGISDNRIIDFVFEGTPFSPYALADNYLNSNIIKMKDDYVYSTTSNVLVYGASVLKLTNLAAVTFDNFRFGYNGQLISVVATASSVTLNASATLVLTSGNSLVLTTNKLYQFRNIEGVWYQL